MRQRGVSCSLSNAQVNTKRLGRQLISIIALQFPWSQEFRNINARSIPYNFPIDPQKFQKTIPLPLYSPGIISATTLVTITAVNPLEKPYRSLASSILEQLSTQKNMLLITIWRIEPAVITGFLPYVSESLPLNMDPAKTPRQKIEARDETCWSLRFHYFLMTGFKKEAAIRQELLRISWAPSFNSIRLRKKTVIYWVLPSPILLSKISSRIIFLIAQIVQEFKHTTHHPSICIVQLIKIIKMKHRTLKPVKNNTATFSQLPHENNRSQIFGQSIQPKKGHQIDGPVDPITRLRHGEGTYRYSNKYFTYRGNYEQGVKQGAGQLILGDGTIIKGTFVNNQLNGDAEISYADGSTYKGGLHLGQKSGKGQYVSKLEHYRGEYSDNQKNGSGWLKTPTCTIEGTFLHNKPDGPSVKVNKYNYTYEGGYSKGEPSGHGKQQSLYTDQKYVYEGQFQSGKFHGKGKYLDESERRIKEEEYLYEGEFSNGIPTLYPNEFRVSIAMAAAGSLPEGQERPQQFTVVGEAPIQYEVESEMQLYLIVQSCYQAPEELDPVQPTQEQIDKLVKDWEAQNKKNKNPPPMPDFNQPRMIKPELVVVEQEVHRPLHIQLAKSPATEQSGEQLQFVKIDYRQLLVSKRAENEEIKAENARKAEEQGAKKGGKNPKGGQPELKLNCFVEAPSEKDKILKQQSVQGKTHVDILQFPDDIPQASYQLIISSPFNKFGEIRKYSKTLTIKAKNAGGKKK